MEKISVFIVDDMIDILDYFSMVLNREKNIEVIGGARGGRECVDMILQKKPDVILMDIQMEYKTAGIDAIEKIKSSWEDAKIIVLTILEDDELLYRAFAAGAVEYILKTDSVARIINSICAVHANQLSLRPEISQKILKEFSKMKSYQSSFIYMMRIVSKLSNAEFEVLCAFRNGDTYKKIARDRHVEEVTIRTQVSRILKKFEMSSMKMVIKQLEELKIFDILKESE